MKLPDSTEEALAKALEYAKDVINKRDIELESLRSELSVRTSERDQWYNLYNQERIKKDETIQAQSRLIEGKQRAIAQYCKERDDLFERNQQLKEALKNLVNANPNDSTWNYQAAGDQARKLLEK
jgi:hypothetical protein